MKVLALVLLAPVVFAAAQTNPENPKFSLTIKAIKPEVALGADVDIEIKITNTSEDPLTFDFSHHGGLPDGYQYEVRDEQGALAVRVGKRYVQFPNGDSIELPRILPGSRTKGGVLPGKSQLCAARISEVYLFDHPGKYTIQASRKLPDMPEVYSNIITVTVVAPTPGADAPK